MAALRLVCLFVVLAIGLVQSLDIPKIKDVPLLVKTLKNLNRGPPHQVVTKRANVQEKWITQKLDNFDASNTQTYQMVCIFGRRSILLSKNIHKFETFI